MLPLFMPVGSPWAGDPVGQEPPLGYSIAEVGAALGGAGGSIAMENIADEPLRCVEVSKPVSGRGEGDTNGGQR
jgi:hypothetical protein